MSFNGLISTTAHQLLYRVIVACKYQIEARGGASEKEPGRGQNVRKE